MSLSFRSSSPEIFQIVGRDPDGRQRVATAQRESGSRKWDLKLVHPSGRNWSGQFHGPNVLDALGELMNSKDVEFRQEKGRGDRPHVEQPDRSIRIDDSGNPLSAPIRSYER